MSDQTRWLQATTFVKVRPHPAFMTLFAFSPLGTYPLAGLLHQFKQPEAGLPSGWGCSWGQGGVIGVCMWGNLSLFLGTLMDRRQFIGDMVSVSGDKSSFSHR